MYKVFAEFDSAESADLAAGRVRENVSGILRVASRRMQWNDATERTDGDSGDAAAADWLFTPNELYQGGTFYPLAQSVSESDGVTEPSERHEYMLCAEGSLAAVRQASHLLRGLGGLHVSVTDAPGRFF